MGFAADSARCQYADGTGQLQASYSAHKPQEARGWVPLALVSCTDKVGVYFIVSHKAVGLGQLAEPPLRVVPVNMAAAKPKVRYATAIASRDERSAYKVFDANPNIEVVVLFGESKTQIQVFRRQFDRVVSNTLFLE